MINVKFLFKQPHNLIDSPKMNELTSKKKKKIQLILKINIHFNYLISILNY